ncbi:MAG: hypothetical protein CME71_11505 [Halobacteriovorax sp.]|nr:hypothetical protein [Halobacteriovorax sp.]
MLIFCLSSSMKILITLTVLLSSLSLFAKSYVTINCNSWGTGKTFELSGELDESGSNYLDGLINLRVFNGTQLVFEKKRVDSTGFFWFDEIDDSQVYLAELMPLDRSSFQFLSIAANHPRPSGNSYLRFNNHEYQAECFIR